MELLSDFIKYLASTLESIGLWAYLLIFAVTFADSIVVIGSFASGSIFLFLAGVLMVHGLFQFATVALFGAAGSIIGGIVNYHLGAAGTGFLARRAYIKKEMKLIRGEGLLERYGGMGILIGRFLGPVSSIIAFSAGFAGMKQKSFMIWNILAGLLWAALYVFLGAVFGNSFVFFDAFTG